MNNPLWGDGWADVRAAWSLDPTIAHLNHGSFGAVPVTVQEAQQRLRVDVEANPNRFYGRLLMERLTNARRSVATFIGADIEGLAIIPNATTGLSLALAAVPLGQDDEVLITDHAYPAARHAAERACARSGSRLRVVALGLPPAEATEDEAAERWRSALFAVVGERTRVCLLERIASHTGLCLPVASWVDELRARGVATIVDAAHVPGTLDEAPVGDFWVASLHKWPCAPRGTGLLAVHPRWRAQLRPLAPTSDPAPAFPDNLAWWGTADYSGVLCAPEALAFLGALGWSTLRAYNRSLVRLGGATVAAALGTSVALGDGFFATMALVPLPAGVATTRQAALALVARIADELRAEVAVASWGERGWLRLSAHAYNCPAEYERLAGGLVRLLS